MCLVQDPAFRRAHLYLADLYRLHRTILFVQRSIPGSQRSVTQMRNLSLVPLSACSNSPILPFPNTPFARSYATPPLLPSFHAVWLDMRPLQAPPSPSHRLRPARSSTRTSTRIASSIRGGSFPGPRWRRHRRPRLCRRCRCAQRRRRGLTSSTPTRRLPPSTLSPASTPPTSALRSRLGEPPRRGCAIEAE